MYRLRGDGTAEAVGIFQLESSGMRELLVKMAPTQFTDLIALVALYRPGPLESGMVNDFVETKHGRATPNYPLPQLKPVLEETYGVIVYQEQVMKIANILASYSLGDADLLRRAMGKKDPAEMAKQRVRFLDGARRSTMDELAAITLDDECVVLAEQPGRLLVIFCISGMENTLQRRAGCQRIEF